MSAINCNRLCRHWGRSQEECISDTDGVCKGRDGIEFRDFCDTRFPCIYPDKCTVAAPPIAPAPQWSTEPPTEFDAWFFWRVPCDPSALFIVQIVEDCVTHEPLYINGGCDSPLPIGDFIESVGWHEENDLEWYPIRIEPPR